MKRIPVIMIASLFVIGIPAITQSDPVPKKNGNKYVLYEERTDNGAVCHLFQAQQANGCLEKPMVKGTLFRSVNPEKPDVPLNKNDAFQKVQKRHVQEKR